MPRKQPSQARSRATVDAILDAGARVLVKHGFDGLTTNAVAERAGVSIGSLYQYFPNKQALVAALVERHIEDSQQATLGSIAAVATLPMAEAVRVVITAVIRAHEVDPELHRVIIEQVPRVGRLARLRELDEITTQLISALISARKHELDVRDPDLAAWVLVSAIEAIVHRSVLFRPERLADPRVVDEACMLVLRYLGVGMSCSPP